MRALLEPKVISCVHTFKGEPKTFKQLMRFLCQIYGGTVDIKSKIDNIIRFRADWTKTPYSVGLKWQESITELKTEIEYAVECGIDVTLMDIPSEIKMIKALITALPRMWKNKLETSRPRTIKATLEILDKLEKKYFTESMILDGGKGGNG